MRQSGFQRYPHAGAPSDPSLCVVARARAYPSRLYKSQFRGRLLVVCLLVSRFRAVMVCVVSCRVASPAPGQVTSRPLPSPLVRLLAPCPVLRSHQTMPRHLVLSSLLGAYLLSSHLPFSDLPSPPHRTFSPPIFSISFYLWGGRFGGCLLPEISGKPWAPASHGFPETSGKKGLAPHCL